jgi:peptide deformylase
MAILKVARMGHPILRAKALPVPPDQIPAAPIQRLIDDMFETMREYSGIGLAGPQVHQGVRIFVAGLREGGIGPAVEDDDEMPLMAVINPQVTLIGEPDHQGWEGCLSIPDIRGLVPRAPSVRLEGFDRTGKRISFTAKGLPARVIQHENDHLDGVLFFDRMATFESLTFMDEYRRYWTAEDSE